MSFKPTLEYVTSIFDPSDEATNLISAMDPEVSWMISSEMKDPLTKTGVYNRESYTKEVMGELQTKLAGPPKMTIHDIEISGQKAIIEATGELTGRNGKSYVNRFCWILIFSPETGKIITGREYLNTALMKELMVEN